MYYGIYMFEEPQKLRQNGALTNSGTHCFLGLVAHEEGHAPRIVEELHFKKPRRGDTSRVQPVVYKQSRHNFDDAGLKSVCHQQGDEAFMRQKWKQALKFASMVRANPPKFQNSCAFSFNCRAFAIGALRAMGYDYKPAEQQAQKGILARVWDAYAPAFLTEPDKTAEDYERALGVG